MYDDPDESVPVPYVCPGWRVRRILPSERAGHWSATSIVTESDWISELTIRNPDDCNHGEGDNVCPDCIESWSGDYDFYVISSDPNDPVASQPYVELTPTRTEVVIEPPTREPAPDPSWLGSIDPAPMNEIADLIQTANGIAESNDFTYNSVHLDTIRQAYISLPSDAHRSAVIWSLEMGVDNATSSGNPRYAGMYLNLIDHLKG